MGSAHQLSLALTGEGWIDDRAHSIPCRASLDHLVPSSPTLSGTNRPMEDLLRNTAERAARYLAGLAERPVRPDPAAIEALVAFDTPLPTSPTDPAEVLARLDDLGSPATMGSAGGRYFGFVLGGSLPATLAVNWLAGAWDQNAGMAVGSPVAAFLEEVTLRWLVELLDLPAGTGGGFVTGATAANLSGLAAARHALLARQDWDVEAQGLPGAPELTVVVGQEVHLSVLKALSLLGLGRERVVRVPVDDQGRLRADALPTLDERTIVCLQAGNVNTGAFDPLKEVCAAARQAGAWVHVDGAFGLWAPAAPSLTHLAEGLCDADSWATDGHKWLNVPYDSGIVLCREPEHLRAAMGGSAAYLVETDQREPWHHTPEMSRRARGLEVWAALASLGSEGVAEPGPGLLRRSRAHAGSDRGSAGGWHLLVQRHHLAGTHGDAHQRLLLAHHRGGRGSLPGGDPAHRWVDGAHCHQMMEGPGGDYRPGPPDLAVSSRSCRPS